LRSWESSAHEERSPPRWMSPRHKGGRLHSHKAHPERKPFPEHLPARARDVPGPLLALLRCKRPGCASWRRYHRDAGNRFHAKWKGIPACPRGSSLAGLGEDQPGPAPFHVIARGCGRLLFGDDHCSRSSGSISRQTPSRTIRQGRYGRFPCRHGPDMWGTVEVLRPIL